MKVKLRHSIPEILMMGVALAILYAFMSFLAPVLPARSETPLPFNQGYVTDEVGILSPVDRLRVEQSLKSFERSRSDHPQFVVVIINKMPDEGLEAYSTRLFREWGVGQKNQNNGVLWVIHPKPGNHADMRMEVGRGMEGAITDTFASSLNRTVAGPLINKGLWADAIVKVANSLAKEMDPENKQANYVNEVNNSNHGSIIKMFLMWFLFAAILIGTFIIIVRRKSQRGSSSTPTPGVSVKLDTTDDVYLRRQEALARQQRENTLRSSDSQPSRLRPDPTTMTRTSPSMTNKIVAGAAGVAAVVAAEELLRKNRERDAEDERRRRRDDDTSSYGSALSGGYSSSSGSSSSSSSSSSDSGSSYSGGGGDSGGGGSSDSC